MKVGLQAFLIIVLIAGLADWSMAEKAYDTREKERYWSLFLRTKTDSPAEEIEYARKLEESGRNWAARRRYSALVKHWPTSEEAPAAQLALARLLDEKGKKKAAFDAYQQLFDRYPGSFSVQEVLNRQFEIAVDVMNTKKLRFLFGGLSDPEDAIPLFEQIIANAPEWERTANAQYLIGEAYERAGRYELAVPAYQAVELRYPDNPLATRSAFMKCKLLYELSGRHENDGRLREKALSELALFVARHPESKHYEEALKMKRIQYERCAQAAFEVAKYYDETSGRPEAALIEYRRMRQKYPDSEWTDKAKERITALKKQIGNSDEENE